MRKLILVLIVSAAMSNLAHASCVSGHWLQTKNDDGTILTLEDGSTWRVLDGGEVDSEVWLETESLLVCDGGTIINTDDNNTEISVELLSR